MATTKLTYREYALLPDDQRYELIEGELYLIPSPTTRHQRASACLFRHIDTHVSMHQSGEVFFAPLDIVLSDTNVLQPDVIFISNERAAIVTEPNIQGAPDLAIEVLSPSTSARDRGIKRSLYERFGVRELWFVDLEQRTIEVWAQRAEGLVRVASHGPEAVVTSFVLPGLEIPVASVLARP